ncbi:MAG: hypothetical protein HC896_03855 [Bacteroidales bacterium]|nr:hypothetical protein [Bacteroidales bacterium]
MRATLFLGTLVVLFGACRQSSYKADVSDIKVSLGLKRFEQDLFDIS